MKLGRRGLIAVLAAAPSGGAARAQTVAGRRGEPDLWFDPTQLPSFTGTVERYLPNPRGEVDGLIFKEGPQVVFPPDVAEAVRRDAPTGKSVIIWGIRARRAPVITMLAFAPSSDATPVVVDRFYWRLGGRAAQEGSASLRLSGTVKQPYYTPQGDVAGAILEDGSVVLVPAAAVDSVQDILKPGQALAASGPGREGPDGRALLAQQLGPAPDALQPLPGLQR
ncbi:hypothetical protein JMJ56_16025 [Belnapia sp. T18]|uniref:Uncharacterized protein n=1 Tax=Belnapia arida TaxID=2804533 RepID=A0ABS1U8A2_9PROT|nr:hypothetical protein [Belnapia arida]MBL6079526.1 hypothetical protein [Belnapia arida]